MKTANELSLTLLNVIDDVINNKVTMEKASAVTRLADKYTKDATRKTTSWLSLRS